MRVKWSGERERERKERGGGGGREKGGEREKNGKKKTIFGFSLPNQRFFFVRYFSFFLLQVFFLHFFLKRLPTHLRPRQGLLY